MNEAKRAAIEAYRKNITGTNVETVRKELFKDLLHVLYGEDEGAREIIGRMSLGAETTILNIPRREGARSTRGRADTLYNNVVIEFEADIKAPAKLAHAKEQLAEYAAGSAHSGKRQDYTLIATDCLRWEVFAPGAEAIGKLDTLTVAQLNDLLEKVPSASFALTPDNAEAFYYWIDRFLFRQERQRATLKAVEEAFGYYSPVFRESFAIMQRWFREAKKFGEIQVSYEQWRKFLSIAYGTFNDTEDAFLIHSYLSVFSKMLAYAVVSGDEFIDESETRRILSGEIFFEANIANFVENDFFHWVGSERNFGELRPVFRLLAQEIAGFDFTDVDEDILKGVYQELIDLDTRHALGEYYTPDWLCERVMQALEPAKTARILDPSCGSGSFIRAALARLRALHPDITAEELAAAVWGIDIHPLSVQIAKTTVLIALGKDLRKAKRPVRINIIMANTLLAPEGVSGKMFGENFKMQIDRHKLLLSTDILKQDSGFDAALEAAEELATQTMGGRTYNLTEFEKLLRAQPGCIGFTSAETESFHKIYGGLKAVKEEGRDSIWKFILQNGYKPYFLSGKFDLVVGNPPWFTYADVRNEEYQDTLAKLADAYKVRPQKVKNFPHLEIAAIFLAYCSAYFLKEGGALAFVVPRSFFSADHHDNTRSGVAKGFRLTGVWDLDKVKPLFNVPSCVLFAQPALLGKKPGAAGIEGKIFSGRLPRHNASWAEAEGRIEETEAPFYLVKQGTSTALSPQKRRAQTKVNAYKSLFKQGATIVPRGFYFVEFEGDAPPDFDADRLVSIRTANSVKADAKAPWKGLELQGRMEARYLFLTALSRSILPYALHSPDLVALPLAVEAPYGRKQLRMLTVRGLQQEGTLYASRWFQNVENIWALHRTEKNSNMSANDYVDWHSKLTNQDLNLPYLVIYNASAKDANATVVRREDLPLEFLVESKGYYFATSNPDEAYYLSAILNSSIPNEAIKDFQTRGNFGPRDVHKKILDVYFPRYSAEEPAHQQLAALSAAAHQKAAQFLRENPPRETPMGARELGKMRTAIKAYLAAERSEMDKWVKKVVG